MDQLPTSFGKVGKVNKIVNYFTSHDSQQVTLISIICFLVICIYGKFRCNNPNYHDPLMKELGFLDLDGWSLTHLCFFFSLGYFYPKAMYTAMALGISWELFEHILGKSRPGLLGGFGDCITTDPALQKGPWWFGRATDIFMNLSGFLLGVYLSQK